MRSLFFSANISYLINKVTISQFETLSFKFTSLSSASQFTSASSFEIQSNGKPYSYSSAEKALKFITAQAKVNQSNPDPIIEFGEKTKVNGVKTSECSVLHIRMKASKSGTPAQVFFRVDTMPKNSSGKTYYSEDYQYTFHFKDPGVWQDYYIDLKSHDGFTGNIESIRFDPGNLANNEIYLSEFE